jgi:hypothetical protein
MANNLKDIYIGVNKSDTSRHENDLYPTPPLATYVLQKYVDVPKNIVEPCAGRGNISIELIRNGFNVRSFDLHDYPDKLCAINVGHDVLTLPTQVGYNGLVTNPPYFKNLPHKIAKKGLAEYDFTALFVRLTFLEGKRRQSLFAKNPPSTILFMSDRIRFGSGYPEAINKHEQLGGMIAYCWVVWSKKEESRRTELKWILLEDEYDEWRQHYENSITVPDERRE